tara:strand:+ start:388 stop:513 length:126 start_codon:yes stop_codon:yes gene_type:complete
MLVSSILMVVGSVLLVVLAVILVILVLPELQVIPELLELKV